MELNEDKAINKGSFWFHGSGHTNYEGNQTGSNMLRKPTVDQPLFLCNNPKYSAQFIGNENPTFFIFKMKNDINALDVRSKADVQKLKLPKIIQQQLFAKKNIFGAIVLLYKELGLCASNFFENKAASYHRSIYPDLYCRNSYPDLKIRKDCFTAQFDVNHVNSFFRNIKNYRYDVVEDVIKDRNIQVGDLNELFEWIKQLDKSTLTSNVINKFKHWIEREEGFPVIVSNDPDDLDAVYAFCRLIYRQIYNAGFCGFIENIFGGESSEEKLCLVLFNIDSIEWILNRPLNSKEIIQFFRLLRRENYMDDMDRLVQAFKDSLSN